MPTCPNGHQSVSDDWCEVCGHRMAGAGGPAGAVPPPPPPAPGYGYPGPGGDPNATAQAELCPQCRTPREAMAPFCEECRWNFLTNTATSYTPVAPPGMPGPPPGMPGPPPGMPSPPPGLNLPPGFQAGPGPSHPAPGPGPQMPPPAPHGSRPPDPFEYQGSRPSQMNRPAEPLAGDPAQHQGPPPPPPAFNQPGPPPPPSAFSRPVPPPPGPGPQGFDPQGPGPQGFDPQGPGPQGFDPQGPGPQAGPPMPPGPQPGPPAPPAFLQQGPPPPPPAPQQPQAPAPGADDWMLPPPSHAQSAAPQAPQAPQAQHAPPAPPQPHAPQFQGQPPLPQQGGPLGAPPLGGQQQPPFPGPGMQGAGWTAVIGPDREYFLAMMQRSGPEASGLNLPAYSPEQHLPLDGNQVSIGRRRHSTGESPDIDLSVPPEDPGVSHQHAVLVAQPDGTWAVVDQNSTNGTTINGAEEPIQPYVPIPLQDGDRVHVGAWTTITIRRG
ncbi:FHA domain-containing protein [Streptomyces sp. NPDC048604]|uniref:FHA domain-containing protein n=1 Tax=Streptomyces sp. NPDC048604 TaxID=3365578 RepID=UPI003723168A